MSVFITRKIPEAGLELLRSAGVPFEIGELNGEKELSREALLEGVRSNSVLLSLLTERIDRQVLTANPSLRGVANMAVGLDNIDLDAARELAIPIGNTPGVLTDATADLTWALLLAAARRIPSAHAYMVAGRYKIWGPELMCGATVAGRTLGIVGFGRIGRAVARRAAGFDMRVLACGRSVSPSVAGAASVDLPKLLSESDFVSLHVPLTESTRHLIGPAEFRRMKRGAVLVNTARGPVVDERALVEALRAGEIAAAGLDVFEHEPAMVEGLAELENVVVLPHIGSATHETRARMAVMAAERAVEFLG